MRMTTTQAMDLLKVKNGADIYDYGIALNLRAIEKERPQWINIGPAESAPADGAKRQPYFGAIATAAGISAARRAIKRNDDAIDEQVGFVNRAVNEALQG